MAVVVVVVEAEVELNHWATKSKRFVVVVVENVHLESVPIF